MDVLMQCLQGVFYGELFSELGLVLGSSLDPVTTNFIEPAFINDTVSCNTVSLSPLAYLMIHPRPHVYSFRYG